MWNRYQKNDVDIVILDPPEVDEFSYLFPSKYSFSVNGYIFFYCVENRATFEMVLKYNVADKLKFNQVRDLRRRLFQ